MADNKKEDRTFRPVFPPCLLYSMLRHVVGNHLDFPRAVDLGEEAFEPVLDVVVSAYRYVVFVFVFYPLVLLMRDLERSLVEIDRLHDVVVQQPYRPLLGLLHHLVVDARLLVHGVRYLDGGVPLHVRGLGHVLPVQPEQRANYADVAQDRTCYHRPHAPAPRQLPSVSAVLVVRRTLSDVDGRPGLGKGIVVPGTVRQARVDAGVRYLHKIL